MSCRPRVSTAAAALSLDESASDQSAKLRVAPWSLIVGDYFRAMGIPLVSGRYSSRQTRRTLRSSSS